MENSFNNKVLVAQVSETDRVAFYKKTYAHVGLGVLLFIVFEYLLLQNATIVEFALSMTQGYKWLLLLGGFMLITNYAESTALKTSDKNLQYLAYSGYVFAEAFIFIPLIYMAISYTNNFEIIAIKQGALLLYNTFEYHTKEDYIYYLLFTLEQLQLNPETIQLVLLGLINKEDDIYSITYKYIRNVSFGNRMDTYNFTKTPTTNYSYFTLLKSL